uniref:WxxW domain-containing protein n=1 Tax=Hucho hucho TaxID=62062 RepID=A0A4W5NJ86_9TELE
MLSMWNHNTHPKHHNNNKSCVWSDWINLGQPTSGSEGGDNESIKNIVAAGYHICSAPEAVECRAKQYPGLQISQLGQDVTCNPSVGLICDNNKQGLQQKCFDYEIRVKCCQFCEWSPWYNVDYPQFGPGGGDNESIKKIIESGKDICEKPVDVICQAVRYPGVPLSELGQDVECNTKVGLICLNKDQGIPPICLDYEIKVKC